MLALRLARMYWRLPSVTRRQWQQKEIQQLREAEAKVHDARSLQESYSAHIKSDLWGLSNHCDPLRQDLFAQAVRESSTRPELHGMRQCLPSAHSLVHDRGFIEDVGALPCGRVGCTNMSPVLSYIPGLCPEKTPAELYAVSVRFQDAFTKLMSKLAKSGDAFQIRMHPKHREMTVIIGHVRHAHPKQVCVLRAALRDHTLHLQSKTTEHGPTLDVLFASEIAKELLYEGGGPGCTIRKLELEPSIGSLSRFSVRSYGEEVQVDYLEEEKPKRQRHRPQHDEMQQAFDLVYRNPSLQETPMQAPRITEAPSVAAPQGVFRGSLRIRRVEDSGSEGQSDSDVEIIHAHLRARKKTQRQEAKAQRKMQRGHRDRRRRQNRDTVEQEEEEQQQEEAEEEPRQPEPVFPAVVPAMPAGSASSSSGVQAGGFTCTHYTLPTTSYVRNSL